MKMSQHRNKNNRNIAINPLIIIETLRAAGMKISTHSHAKGNKTRDCASRNLQNRYVEQGPLSHPH
jgi:hypothetical protein